MGDFNRFLSRIEQCKAQVEKSSLTQATILHHDEADGLTSAALTKLSLEHLGLKTELICLDKLYPEVIDDVQARQGQLIVYVDMGSAHIDWLSKYNRTGNLIVTLDHHDTSEAKDPLLVNLNPELDGFSGEKEASSATVAYMFAKAVDKSLRKYSHLALIGSLEVPGEPQGLNTTVAQDAEKEGLARRPSRGDFKLQADGMHFSRSRAATLLNVLGSVGYYREGPRLGVKACIEGFDQQTTRLADDLEEERKEANRKMLSKIREKGLSQGKLVQWFHAHDTYSGMGGKVVGSFCSYLRFQRPVNPVKYLIGMMNVSQEIPGWGKLPTCLVKVSARAPEPLVGLIEKGSRPHLSRILPEACMRIGGFGDGHSVAASGVFPVGREEEFLGEIDRLAAS